MGDPNKDSLPKKEVTIPKPLLPVGDIPILEVVLRQLAAAGIWRVVVTLGHMGHLLMASIGDGARFGLDIEYYNEDKPRGTAGSLRLVKNLDENFLVMNGDLLTTLDYKKLFEAHIKRNSSATIAVHKREVKIDYGVIYMSSDRMLSDYIEKPIVPYYVSMGINILSRHCVEFIPEFQKFDMPQLILALHKEKRDVVCYETDCYWQDIGRFDDYKQASADFVENPNRFLPHRKTS